MDPPREKARRKLMTAATADTASAERSIFFMPQKSALG
jgi:hypothetical protein